LADPVKASRAPERLRVQPEEEAKAYTKVREGLRRVFKATLAHYIPGGHTDLLLMAGTDDSAILFQEIHASFRSAKLFASPEGLESFLLTLIELFEQSLGAKQNELLSRKIWRSEIYRRRLGGLPETKTLADVAPAEIRLERQKAFSETKRLEILKDMVSSMRRIVKELRSCLEKRLFRS
jgi:hypothetical protein